MEKTYIKRKRKLEKIETCETYDEGYETLCSNPEFGEDEEKPAGKKVKIRLADNQVVEETIVEE